MAKRRQVRRKGRSRGKVLSRANHTLQKDPPASKRERKERFAKDARTAVVTPSEDRSGRKDDARFASAMQGVWPHQQG